MAALWSVYVLILVTFRGQSPLERFGTNLSQLVLMYFALGAALGALVGLLRPLATSGDLGAALVGFVIGAVALWTLAMPGDGLPTSLRRAAWLAVVGGTVGAAVALKFRGSQRPPPKPSR
jgi:hypothetical protein